VDRYADRIVLGVFAVIFLTFLIVQTAGFFSLSREIDTALNDASALVKEIDAENIFPPRERNSAKVSEHIYGTWEKQIRAADLYTEDFYRD
jgi:hypothetical protein